MGVFEMSFEIGIKSLMEAGPLMADASRAGSMDAEIPLEFVADHAGPSDPMLWDSAHGSFGKNPKLYKGRALESQQHGPGREGAQRVLRVAVGGDRASRRRSRGLIGRSAISRRFRPVACLTRPPFLSGLTARAGPPLALGARAGLAWRAKGCRPSGTSSSTRSGTASVRASAASPRPERRVRRPHLMRDPGCHRCRPPLPHASPDAHQARLLRVRRHRGGQPHPLRDPGRASLNRPAKIKSQGVDVTDKRVFMRVGFSVTKSKKDRTQTTNTQRIHGALPTS